MNLAPALQDVDTLFRGDHRVAIEVGRPLLELGEVLDRLQRPLGPEDPLDVHAAQGRRLDPVAKLLRANVSDQVCRAVGAAVLMTVEARDSEARPFAAAVGGQVELLLGERREQQPQPLELLRIQDAVEELVIVVGGHQLAPRHVPEIRASRQVNGRRELWQKPVGNVEVQIEAGQIPARLLLDLVDEEVGKNHAALGMVRMRQRHEALREESLLADLLGRHLLERLPRHAGGQLDQGVAPRGDSRKNTQETAATAPGSPARPSAICSASSSGSAVRGSTCVVREGRRSRCRLVQPSRSPAKWRSSPRRIAGLRRNRSRPPAGAGWYGDQTSWRQHFSTRNPLRFISAPPAALMAHGRKAAVIADGKTSSAGDHRRPYRLRAGWRARWSPTKTTNWDPDKVVETIRQIANHPEEHTRFVGRGAASIARERGGLVQGAPAA